jgi:hypothetical protein
MLPGRSGAGEESSWLFQTGISGPKGGPAICAELHKAWPEALRLSSLEKILISRHSRRDD